LTFVGVIGCEFLQPRPSVAAIDVGDGCIGLNESPISSDSTVAPVLGEVGSDVESGAQASLVAHFVLIFDLPHPGLLPREKEKHTSASLARRAAGSARWFAEKAKASKTSSFSWGRRPG